MTRRFDLSRDGTFVPAIGSKPGASRYDSSGRRVTEDAGRLLFADELPEEPGVEDILVMQIARVCTGLRSTARRLAPLAMASTAWATTAAGQVSAATLCQAATVCAVAAVGGTTLHYWQVAHPPTAMMRTVSMEPAPPQPGVELADATPVPARSPSPEADVPSELQPAVSQPVQNQPGEIASAEPVPAAAPAVAPEPAASAPAEAAAEPVAAPAHALTLQEQLPLSPAAQQSAVAADPGTPVPVTGARMQRAIMARAVPADSAPAADDAPAAAPKRAALIHARVARVMRIAPTVHAVPTVLRIAPPVMARLIVTRRPPLRLVAPRVVMARFDMPHWLLETHMPRTVTVTVMSVPAHNLAKPQERATPAVDSDHDSDSLNVPVKETQPVRPVLAEVPQRNRFVPQYYGQPAFYPRPGYYPPPYYQPYRYPYGPYGYSYGRY